MHSSAQSRGDVSGWGCILLPRDGSVCTGRQHRVAIVVAICRLVLTPFLTYVNGALFIDGKRSRVWCILSVHGHPAPKRAFVQRDALRHLLFSNLLPRLPNTSNASAALSRKRDENAFCSLRVVALGDGAGGHQ